jgi:hypothetical protein
MTYIELADILEVLVQRFNHIVDELKQGKLIDVFVNVNANDKIKGSVPPVNHLILPMLQK